jgi:sugar phosphate permease
LTGLIFVSTSMFFASLVMFTFPKNLRNKTTQVLPAPTKLDENTKTEKNGSGKLKEAGARSKLKDFYTTIKRQLKNDILMFRTASAVLHLLPITGLYIFLPKYLENQFQMASSNASFASGTFGILMMGLGILVTGIISVKFSLSARKVALWIAFTALATAFGMLILSMIGCPMDNFRGLRTNEDSGL